VTTLLTLSNMEHDLDQRIQRIDLLRDIIPCDVENQTVDTRA
jgi:hypothetical protein